MKRMNGLLSSISKVMMLTVFLFFALCSRVLFAETLPVQIALIKTPTPVITHNSVLYAYELAIKNMSQEEIKIARIEIMDEGQQPVATYMGQKLAYYLRKHQDETAVSKNNDTLLMPGEVTIAHLWLQFDSESDAIQTLNHKIWVIRKEAQQKNDKIAIFNVAVPINNQLTPLRLLPPVSGYNWVVSGATAYDALSNHFNGSSTQNDHDPNRFALDWLQICPNGSVTNDSTDLRSKWPAYGHPVLAGAEGKVVAVSANQPELTQLIIPNHQSSLDETLGNYVLLQVNQNQHDYYVLYAHLKADSITVKAGDQVKSGQVIAAIGSVGHSGMPLLHMQVMDSADLQTSEGVPFVLTDIKLQSVAQRIDAEEGLWKPVSLPKMTSIKSSTFMPTSDNILYLSDEKLNC